MGWVLGAAGSRWRRWSLGIAGVLCLGEIGLRLWGFGDPPLMILDPAIEYFTRPGEYRRFHRTIRINQHYMRGDDVRSSKPPLRVLLLGDSIVHGTFRTDQNELISTSLAESLSKRYGAEQVEVLNAATSSWGPVNQWAFLQKVGTFDADIVAWILSSHDLRDVPNPAASALLPQEPFALALQDLWNLLRRKTARVAPPPGDARQQTLAAIEALVAHLERSGIPLVVAQHYSVEELRDEQEPDGAELRRHFQSLHVPVFQLRAVLARATEEGKSPFADQLHLSPEGTRVVGRALAELLASRLAGAAPQR